MGSLMARVWVTCCWWMGGMLSLRILDKTKTDVVCKVVDGGSMGSRVVIAAAALWH